MSEPRPVFGFGYSGKTPHDLLAVAEDLGATVLDIRFSPRSRRPEWSRKRLSQLLGPRYIHVPQFGNVNFKGGPVQISDPEGGLAAFDATSGAVILVCICADSSTCHRSNVAALLGAVPGVRVVEMDLPRETDSVEMDLLREKDQPDRQARPSQM